MDAGGFKEGYSELTLTQMANRAKFWHVDIVVPEDNFVVIFFSPLSLIRSS